VAKKKQPNLKLFERHPVYGILDYYEEKAKALLRKRGLPDTLDALKDFSSSLDGLRQISDYEETDPEKLRKIWADPVKSKQKVTVVARARRILWYADRTHEAIAADDAEGSARWMHSLTRTVYLLDQKRTSKRPRKKKDRKWVGRAVALAPARDTRPAYWTYFQAKHFGQKHAMDIYRKNKPDTPEDEIRGVWFEHDGTDRGCLKHYDGDDHDEVHFDTFLKILSALPKKMGR
jgi:hypothetical protein